MDDDGTLDVCGAGSAILRTYELKGYHALAKVGVKWTFD